MFVENVPASMYNTKHMLDWGDVIDFTDRVSNNDRIRRDVEQKFRKTDIEFGR